MNSTLYSIYSVCSCLLNLVSILYLQSHPILTVWVKYPVVKYLYTSTLICSSVYYLYLSVRIVYCTATSSCSQK